MDTLARLGPILLGADALPYARTLYLRGPGPYTPASLCAVLDDSEVGLGEVPELARREFLTQGPTVGELMELLVHVRMYKAVLDEAAVVAALNHYLKTGEFPALGAA